MRKTLAILFTTSIFMSSCSKEIDSLEIKSDDKFDISLLSFGDGEYDAAGHGTDVTIDWANIESTRFPVIDVKKLAEDHPWMVDVSKLNDDYHNAYYSENAYAYSSEMSKSQEKTKGFNIFKKNISSSHYYTMTSSGSFDGKYIYASYDYHKVLKRVDIHKDLDILTHYLTPIFWNSINTKTPEFIVQEFGTHVMTNIHIGGKLNLRYQAQSRSSERKKASEHGMNWAIGGISGMNNQSGAISERASNYNESLCIESKGGSKSVEPRKGSVTTPPQINITEWRNSITEKDSQLIDYAGDNALIPIWEFITDPAKKAEVKAYVEKYLKDNQVVVDYYFAGWFGNNEEYGWNANKSGQYQEQEFQPKKGTAPSTLFRAPKTGTYKINASFYGYKEGGSGSGSGTIELRVYNSAGVYLGLLVNRSIGAGSGWTRVDFNGNIKLSAGDRIVVRMNGGNVGAIDRWVRYRMENMNIEYISQ